nr:hypothetical protein GCM10020185_74370 [Pseudomonas brassicacearum subsp. brassicacearum]
MRRDTAQRDDLFRLLSISQRSELNSTTDIRLTRQLIEEDVFKTQLESIEYAQSLNALAMVNELIKLPSLRSMLDQILNEALPDLDHRQIRVAFGKGARPGNPRAIQVTESIPLSDAILGYFHHQGWPVGHDIDLTHPGTLASSYSPQQWEKHHKGRCQETDSDAHRLPRCLLGEHDDSLLYVSTQTAFPSHPRWTLGNHPGRAGKKDN